MKKMRFYWEQFLNNRHKYSDIDKLQAMMTIIELGKEVDFYVNTWDREGVNKALLGYSHNNDPYADAWFNYSKLSFDWVDYRLLNFFRRDQGEIIEIFKRSVLKFGQKKGFILIPKQENGILDILGISDFCDKDLKESPHKDFPDRIRPYICGTPKLLIGAGFRIEYSFSFRMDGYELNSWDAYIHPEEGEMLVPFVNRAIRELENLTV